MGCITASHTSCLHLCCISGSQKNQEFGSLTEDAGSASAERIFPGWGSNMPSDPLQAELTVRGGNVVQMSSEGGARVCFIP